MKTILRGWFRASFVCCVARIATHIERHMTAALGGNVQALLVAGKAEVFFLTATCCFQQLVLVIRGVRIVTLEAVSYCWDVNRTLDVGSVLIGVAGDAKSGRCGRDQLDAGDVFGDANLMTA